MIRNGSNTTSYSALSKHSTYSNKTQKSSLREIHQSLSQPRLAVTFYKEKQPIRCYICLVSDFGDMKQRKITLYVFFPERKSSLKLERVKLSQPEVFDLPYYRRVAKYIEDGYTEANRQHPDILKPDHNVCKKIDGYWLNRCLHLVGEAYALVVFVSAQIERRFLRYMQFCYREDQPLVALQEKNAIMFRGNEKFYYKFKIVSVDYEGVIQARLTNTDGVRDVFNVNVIRPADLSFADTQRWLDSIKNENLNFYSPLDLHDYVENAWITLFFQQRDEEEITAWYEDYGLEQDNDGFIRSEEL